MLTFWARCLCSVDLGVWGGTSPGDQEHSTSPGGGEFRGAAWCVFFLQTWKRIRQHTAHQHRVSSDPRRPHPACVGLLGVRGRGSGAGDPKARSFEDQGWNRKGRGPNVQVAISSYETYSVLTDALSGRTSSGKRRTR